MRLRILHLQLLRAPFGILAIGKVNESVATISSNALTRQGRQYNEPSPDIRQSLDDLIFLPMLVLRATLIIPHTLKDGNALLGGEGPRVDGRVREPDHDAYSYQNSEAAQ